MASVDVKGLAGDKTRIIRSKIDIGWGYFKRLALPVHGVPGERHLIR